MKKVLLIFGLVIIAINSLASDVIKAELVLNLDGRSRVLLPRSDYRTTYVQPVWIIFEVWDKDGKIVPPDKIPDIDPRGGVSWMSEVESSKTVHEDCGIYIPVAGYYLGNRGPDTFSRIEARIRATEYTYTLRLKRPITLRRDGNHPSSKISAEVIIKTIYRHKVDLDMPKDKTKLRDDVQNKQAEPTAPTPAESGNVQGTSGDRPESIKVTINGDYANVGEVLRVISKQTGWSVVMPSKMPTMPINVRFDNKDVEVVLDLVLQQHGLESRMVGETLVVELAKKEESSGCCKEAETKQK